MIDALEQVYVGFFEKFPRPTLLFSSNKIGLKKFRDLIDACQKSALTVELNKPPFIVSSNLEITLDPSDNEAAIKKTGDRKFSLMFNLERAAIFAGQIDVLIKNDKPAHQYLEFGLHDEIVVMVSLNEYKPSFFEDAVASAS